MHLWLSTHMVARRSRGFVEAITPSNAGDTRQGKAKAGLGGEGEGRPV